MHIANSVRPATNVCSWTPLTKWAHGPLPCKETSSPPCDDHELSPDGNISFYKNLLNLKLWRSVPVSCTRVFCASIFKRFRPLVFEIRRRDPSTMSDFIFLVSKFFQFESWSISIIYNEYIFIVRIPRFIVFRILASFMITKTSEYSL